MNASAPPTVRVIHDQLRDSALVYHVLAVKTGQPALKTLFQDLEASRQPMIHELVHEEWIDGKEMPQSVSVGGSVDRIWLRVRDAIAHPDASLLLAECERGEERLLDHYDRALADQEVPGHVKRVLEEQRSTLVGNMAALHKADATGSRH